MLFLETFRDNQLIQELVMMRTIHLEMVLFGDQHRLQSIQSTLLLFVGYEDSSFLAVKGSVNTGHSPELNERTIIKC